MTGHPRLGTRFGAQFADMSDRGGHFLQRGGHGSRQFGLAVGRRAHLLGGAGQVLGRLPQLAGGVADGAHHGAQRILHGLYFAQQLGQLAVALGTHVLGQVSGGNPLHRSQRLAELAAHAAGDGEPDAESDGDHDHAGRNHHLLQAGRRTLHLFERHAVPGAGELAHFAGGRIDRLRSRRMRGVQQCVGVLITVCESVLGHLIGNPAELRKMLGQPGHGLGLFAVAAGAAGHQRRQPSVRRVQFGVAVLQQFTHPGHFGIAGFDDAAAQIDPHALDRGIQVGNRLDLGLRALVDVTRQIGHAGRAQRNENGHNCKNDGDQTEPNGQTRRDTEVLHTVSGKQPVTKVIRTSVNGLPGEDLSGHTLKTTRTLGSMDTRRARPPA
ncbi:conserved hypothetical protein, partial [Ricinus communis]